MDKTDLVWIQTLFIIIFNILICGFFKCWEISDLKKKFRESEKDKWETEKRLTSLEIKQKYKG